MIMNSELNIHDKTIIVQTIYHDKTSVKQYRLYHKDNQLVGIIDVNYEPNKLIPVFSYTQTKLYTITIKDYIYILRLDINGLHGQVELCSLWFQNDLILTIKVNGVKMYKFYNLTVLVDFIYELLNYLL
jgi:hypothetical protein